MQTIKSPKGMVEMTREQAEKAAAKMALPSFDSQEDEIYHAQEFAKSRSRGVACIILGLSKDCLRKEWKAHKRYELESKRFRQWCEMSSARWDAARGKFLVFFPDFQTFGRAPVPESVGG